MTLCLECGEMSFKENLLDVIQQINPWMNKDDKIYLYHKLGHSLYFTLIWEGSSDDLYLPRLPGQ